MLEAKGAPADAELVFWTPNAAETHPVTATGLGPLTEHVVPGGRIITGRVTSSSYTVTITPK